METYATENLQSDTMRITERSVALVDVQYGTDPETSRTRLPYHNGLHTRYVMQDFSVLADVVGLDPGDKLAGYCAAAAHDLVQGLGRHEDEQRSADWLAAQMEQQSGFRDQHIEMARLAIIGTEPIFESGRMVGQTVAELDFPSREHERVAQLVASADLGRLFAPEGPYLAHLLLKELSGGQTPESAEQLLSFQASQIPFLESYRYPYEPANTLLTPAKSRVIAYHEALIAQLESGQIGTWQELMSEDLMFMRGLQKSS